MFLKVFALSTLAVCHAVIIDPHSEGHAISYLGGYDSYQAPIYGHGYADGYGHGHEADHYAHPKYKYAYGVKDPYTGDHKSQEEYRDGDVVKGQYTVADPDGTLRVVHYTADDHNGFNAVVEKIGHSVHPAPVHAAPVLVEKVVPIVEKVIYEKPYVVHDHGHGGEYEHGHHGYGY